MTSLALAIPTPVRPSATAQMDSGHGLDFLPPALRPLLRI